MTKMTKRNVYFPDETWNALRKIAVGVPEFETDVSRVVRFACNRLIADWEKVQGDWTKLRKT